MVVLSSRDQVSNRSCCRLSYRSVERSKSKCRSSALLSDQDLLVRVRLDVAELHISSTAGNGLPLLLDSVK